MNNLSNISISLKMKLIIISISAFVAISIATTSTLNEYKVLRQELTYNSILNLKLISDYTVYQLIFDEEKGCYEVLSKVESIDYILDATVYDTSGILFSRFIRKKLQDKYVDYERPKMTDTVYTKNQILNIIKPINFDNNKYGYFHLRSTFDIVHQKIRNYIITMTVLLFITILFAYILASNLEKIISQPILKLANLTREISSTGDYTRQLEVKSKDEIGFLYSEFNLMMNEINQQITEREMKEQMIRELNESLEAKVVRRTQELKLQKDRTQELLRISDQLLLNILPEKIAERLKQGEKNIADYFEDASVVFIDIVDFTQKSAHAEPKRVVEVLNSLYSILDGIASKYGLEKIKTIGDSYMAAAGIPGNNSDNAAMALHFAVEAMQILFNYNTGDGTIIDFRCGIDNGPIIGGIIGEKKFIYDIWGDTVNTASRMEEYSLPGKIHCTERFVKKIKNFEEFPVKVIERGEIDIKGKGLMRTYLIEKI